MQKLFSKCPHVTSQACFQNLHTKSDKVSIPVLYCLHFFYSLCTNKQALQQASHPIAPVQCEPFSPLDYNTIPPSSYNNYASTFKLANQLFPGASPVLTLFRHFNSARFLKQILGLSVQQEQRTASQEQFHATYSKHFPRESQPEEPQCLVADQLLAF